MTRRPSPLDRAPLPLLIVALLAASGLLLLGGCARTSVSVTYDDGAGKKITAEYSSTKDVAAPSFSLERDEQGRIQSIRMSADGALGSPVNAQTNELVGKVVEGAVKGALSGASSGPVSHPLTYRDVERMIWAAQGRAL